MLNLIGFLGSENTALATYAAEIRKLESRHSDAERLLGILQGMADDFSKGFLDSVLRQAEAEVAADYLGQAERLLGEGQPGQRDHIPAAVLLGAVFEKALRTICSRQDPPMAVTTGNGPKKLVVLIDDLKKAGVFNELKAKQLRAWADVRNAAAHGEFDKFTRTDVEAMSTGITTFLGDHL
jgi:hypothetical protein